MARRASTYGLNVLPTVFGGLGLLLVVVNGVLIFANRATQADLNARAQYVNQSVQLNNIEQAIVRAAAAAAINNKDERLGNLLTTNGITYQGAPTTGNTSSVPNAATTSAAGTASQPLRPSTTAGAPAAQPTKGR